MRRHIRVAGAATAVALTVGAVPLVLANPHSPSAFAASFSEGNVVVYRVGDGASALSNAATAVFLDEFTPAGNKVQSVALPTTSSGNQKRLTAAGLSVSEGQITRTQDGRYVAVTGYDAAPGSTGPGGVSLTASAPSSVKRVVGLVDGNATVDTSTTLSEAGAPYIVRSAAAIDASRLWVSGGNGGIRSLRFGEDGAAPVTEDANLGQLNLVNGALLAGSAESSKLVRAGDSAPTSTVSFSPLSGIDDHSLVFGYTPLDLTAADFAGTGADTIYVANGASGGGAIDKYRFDGSTWTKVGSKPVEGLLGLVASKNGSGVSLIATTTGSLVGIVESNASSNSFTIDSTTKLSDAPVNTEFRGVALAPQDPQGPSLLIRSPKAADEVAPSGSIQVEADIVSATDASVTARIDNGEQVSLTKGAGRSWSATIPAEGFGSGEKVLTVSATAGGKTSIVTRGFKIGPGGIVIPANALRAGTYSATDSKITRGGFKSTSYAKSPGGKGLVASSKTTASFKFYGKSAVLHLQAGPKAGKVTIAIDGKPRTIDLYSRKAKDQVVSLAGLANGTHEVKVSSLRQKTKKSKGFNVLFGYVQVTS